MPIATLTNIEKTFGKRILFDKLNLNIYRGQRIGLIGDNGSGKTSLFKVLMGQMLVDTGMVAISRSIRVGYLTQDAVFEPQNTVMDEAELAFADLHRLSHRLRVIEHDMAGLHGEELEKVLRQYQRTQQEFDLAGGYAWRHRLEATLLGIGLDRTTWAQDVATLSGGQRSRLALAKLLINEPDLLLLDEPTNHLDLSAIEWLERYLLDFTGAVVLISHDRFLLDRLATRIVWLNRCRLDNYNGNYTDFVTQRAHNELTQQRAFEKQQADIDKQEEFIRRFQAGQRARQARGRKTRLERLVNSDAMVQQVTQQKKIHLSLGVDKRAGDMVLSVRELSKAYGQNVLWQDVGFVIGRGERVGIIGPNGSGKTTLLEALLGLRDADAGEVRWGANLSIGYYDQRLDDLDPDNTVIEEAAAGRQIGVQEIRDVLAMLLFRGEDVEKPVRILSGGERARVRLAQLLLDRPNVLLMDEPTNHLDIASREALEAALAGFEGTILCVSHDRYFLNKTVKRLLVLQGDRVVDFAGSYTGWMARLEAQRAAEAAAEARRRAGAPSPTQARPRSASRKDNPYLRPFGRLSTEELEAEIVATEQKVAESQAAFANPDVFKDAARSQQVQSDYEAATQKLQQLEEEYFAREE